MIIDRITTLIRRRKAASEINVRFDRSSAFQLPTKILLNGHMIDLNLPDENGVKVAFIDLLFDDCYGCRSLKQRGEKVKTVLDIGANVGLFGIAARNIFPLAKIHCYEPNRQLEPYLKTQAKAGKFDYFIEAVGRFEGMISLEINEDSVQTRSNHEKVGSTPQITFRQAIDRIGGEIDFLKIDCEGAEWEIFQDEESWRKVKNLSMEYHLFEPNQTEDQIISIIEDFGFTITSFIPIENYGLLTAKR